MGLRDTIKNLVNNAITTGIGDLKSTAVFRSVVHGDYDVITGVTAKTVTTYTVQCVVTNIKDSREFIDYADHLRNMAGIAQADRKLLVPYLQMPNVDVDALDDEALVDGELYNVLDAKIDPSGSLYTFILKSKGGGTVGVD